MVGEVLKVDFVDTFKMASEVPCILWPDAKRNDRSDIAHDRRPHVTVELMEILVRKRHR